MRRRLRLLVVVGLVAVLVGGVAAVVLATEPDLDDAQQRVDARWLTMRKPLQLRYQVLAAAEIATTEAGGGDRAVVQELRSAFDRWAKLAGRADAAADPGAEAEVANQLEALAARLRADVNASERLKGVAAIQDALQKFDAAVVPPPLVRAYNRAVNEYQDTREGAVAKIVASVFGYDTRPTFVVGS